jgi:hypothetical protein
VLGDGHGAVTFRAVAAQPPSTPLYGLATGGVAIAQLLAALDAARELHALYFGAAPVQGMPASGGLGPAAVIVNLSGRPAPVLVPADLRGRGYVELWTAPNALVRGLSSLHTRTGSAPVSLVLPPLSLVRIGPG